MMVIFLLIVVTAGVVSVAWASGVHISHKKHPKHKSDSWTDWNITETDKEQIL